MNKDVILNRCYDALVQCQEAISVLDGIRNACYLIQEEVLIVEGATIPTEKAGSKGHKRFLKNLFDAFGTIPWEGHLFDLRRQTNTKIQYNYDIKLNLEKLRELGLIEIIVMERRPYNNATIHPWYVRFKITAEGEALAKRLE